MIIFRWVLVLIPFFFISCGMDGFFYEANQNSPTPTSTPIRSVTLAWDANSESDIAGYRLYYGFASGQYETIIDVGNMTTYEVSNLETGRTYFFVVTAYNTSGLESDPSNEISYTPPN